MRLLAKKNSSRDPTCKIFNFKRTCLIDIEKLLERNDDLCKIDFVVLYGVADPTHSLRVAEKKYYSEGLIVNFYLGISLSSPFFSISVKKLQDLSDKEITFPVEAPGVFDPR